MCTECTRRFYFFSLSFVRGTSIFTANLRCRDRLLPRDPKSTILHEWVFKTSIQCFRPLWRGAVTMLLSEDLRATGEFGKTCVALFSAVPIASRLQTHGAMR